MPILDRARFATAVAMLGICMQMLSLANASQPVWPKSRGLENRSCLSPFKGRRILRLFTICPPAHLVPGETTPRPTARRSFKFDPDDCGVLVPVRIGAKEYTFLLDTGCTMNVFDTSLQPYLGQPAGTIETRDATGKFLPLALYSAPDAYVGSLPLGEHRVACYDFTPIREASGRDIRGCLGMEFLKNWVISIDFDEGRVDFLPKGTAAQPAWGGSVPFEYGDTEMPRISATLGKDIETSFEVDTGCFGTGDLDWVSLFLLSDRHEARNCGKVRQMALSGEYSSSVSRLSHLSVGPFHHDNLRFSGGRKNILGLDYLSRYRVTIDFPNQQLYLAKAKRFASYDHGPTTGLGALFKASGIIIEYVDEEGPAFAAGVRAKDVLVELCGKPASVLKPREIGTLAKAGHLLTMTVERDGKRIQTSFIPYEYEDEPRPKGTLAAPNGVGTTSPAGASAVTGWPCRQFRGMSGT